MSDRVEGGGRESLTNVVGICAITEAGGAKTYATR